MSGSWISYFQSSYLNKSPWNQPNFTKIRAKYYYFILLLGKIKKKEYSWWKNKVSLIEEMEQRDGDEKFKYSVPAAGKRVKPNVMRSLPTPLSLPLLFFTLWRVDRGIGPSQPGDPMKFWESGFYIYPPFFHSHPFP